MINGLRFLLAHGLLCMVGAPVVLIPRLRVWSAVGKAAAAFAAGAVILTIEAILLGILGVAVDPVLLVIPLATIGVLLWVTRRRVSTAAPQVTAASAKTAVVVACASTSLLALSLLAGHATSTDFLLFWGVKAVRFAQVRAIDSQLLAWPYFKHARPFYPPLVPVVGAWATAAAGQMPWRMAPLATLFWFAATALLVSNVLRERLRREQALIVASFWTVALGTSLASSYSGASAEAPLLLFTTAAAALLACEQSAVTFSDRATAGFFLAGAVLTKVEGSVAAALIIASTAIRDLASRERKLTSLMAVAVPPLVAGLTWFLFLDRYRIPITPLDPGAAVSFRGDLSSVLRELSRNLSAGTYWLSWSIPLLFLFTSFGATSYRQTLPLLAPATGILLFLIMLYWHEGGDLVQRMRWEVPRVSQTPLSFVILAAGLSSAARLFNQSGGPDRGSGLV